MQSRFGHCIFDSAKPAESNKLSRISVLLFQILQACMLRVCTKEAPGKDDELNSRSQMFTFDMVSSVFWRAVEFNVELGFIICRIIWTQGRVAKGQESFQ